MFRNADCNNAPRERMPSWVCAPCDWQFNCRAPPSQPKKSDGCARKIIKHLSRPGCKKRAREQWAVVRHRMASFCFPLCEMLAVLWSWMICVKSDSSGKPVRITLDIRIDASTFSSQQLRSCFRVLLNAAYASIPAFQGSSVKREAKL
jgi:hypothetical protein